MKKVVIIFLAGLVIVLGGLYLFNKIYSHPNTLQENAIKEDTMKEDAIKKFYSSYTDRSIDIFNDSVVDSLKLKTEESKNLRKLLYDDLVSFELLDMKENKENPVNTINGVSYLKENIAEFTVSYHIDFDKNIYGTAAEGRQSVRKVIVRKDKNSPWLVAGQLDGHGY